MYLMGETKAYKISRVNVIQSTIPNYINNNSWNRLVRQRVYANCLKENGTIDSFQEIGYIQKYARIEGFNGSDYLKIANSPAFISASEALEKQLGGCLRISETPRQLEERGIPYEKFLQSRGISMKQASETLKTDLAYCSTGQEYNNKYKKSFLDRIRLYFLNTTDPRLSYERRKQLYEATIASLRKICPHVW